ncbi:GL11496 [Drosophila persimilis]|uniref:GL11496 n=1 Tax=Drosophila persimilis TaxID=7234 RepID=B4GB66_DROPE|nr:GL11496 [Drosophila persimilis]
MTSPNSKQDTRIVISHYDTITTRCTQILTGTWNLICSGGYPLDALIRYDGRLVAAGDRYAVFRSQVEPDSLLAVFRSRAVALCKILRIQSMHEFDHFNLVPNEEERQTQMEQQLEEVEEQQRPEEKSLYGGRGVLSVGGRFLAATGDQE